MKRILFLAAFGWAACNNQSQTASAPSADSDSAPAENLTYAYTMDHPVDFWERGDDKNIAVAMQSLKDWENGDVPASLASFGDSIHLQFDNFDATLSKDSVISMLTAVRKNLSAIKIDMDDCESVKSKDGTREYVSFWYKQTNTYADGKVDSMFVMDDLRMKDGKIIGLDEKSRKLGPAN